MGEDEPGMQTEKGIDLKIRNGSESMSSRLHLSRSDRRCFTRRPMFPRASAVTSAAGPCALLRRCDRCVSEDVVCKHQSFGRRTVSKLAAYSPWPSHTLLLELRLIARRLRNEEQLIYTKSNCTRTWRDGKPDRGHK